MMGDSYTISTIYGVAGGHDNSVTNTFADSSENIEADHVSDNKMMWSENLGKEFSDSLGDFLVLGRWRMRLKRRT